MSTRTIIDGESPLISWETWDQIKHTEGFVLVAATLFAALLGWFLGNAPVRAYGGLATTILCFAMFALGFNLLLGQTGLLSFGHAVFWGGSAYAAAYFAEHVAGYPLAMILVGTLFAFVVAFLAAFILLRLHTVYFAIVTLAIGQVLYFLAREPLEHYTGGVNGLRVSGQIENLLGVIALDTLLIEPLRTLWPDFMYIFLAICFILVVMFVARVRKSPYGLLFKAIRENETRASFVGLDVWRYKFAALLLSATITGFSGALYALDTGSADVNRLFWQTSGDIVVMTVLGGLGTLAGPILGATVFIYLSRVVNTWSNTIPFLGFLGGIGQYSLLIVAVVFTVVVWVYPTGLWGLITTLTSKLRSIGGDR